MLRIDDIPQQVADDIQRQAVDLFRISDISLKKIRFYDKINSPINKNLQVCVMDLKLRELTLKNEILQVYEIYKHCMFMPTEEKFSNKVDLFLNDIFVKIFACFEQDKIVGIMVVSFKEQKKIEIIGIAVDVSARGKGIGSYMINQVINNYGLLSVYAETDNDAVGFYRKNGFNIMEFSETYDGATVVRYKCELTK